jgi:hypothetical protein
MTEPEYVRVHNNCAHRLVIRFRYRRRKKGPPRRPSNIVLQPQQVSQVVPWHLLVGAEGWSRLRELSCVKFEPASYTPGFVEIQNTSATPLTLSVAPAPEKRAAPTSVVVKPRGGVRRLYLGSIQDRRRLKRLESRGEVLVRPLIDIGPTTGRGGAVGSYGSEDVYICYECGGPIVFRGSPPTPVHI